MNSDAILLLLEVKKVITAEERDYLVGESGRVPLDERIRNLAGEMNPTVNLLEDGKIEMGGVVFAPVPAPLNESPYITEVGDTSHFFISFTGRVRRAGHVERGQVEGFNAFNSHTYAEKVAFREKVRRKFDDYIHRMGLLPGRGTCMEVIFREGRVQARRAEWLSGGFRFEKADTAIDDLIRFEALIAYMGEDLKRFFESYER